MRTERYKGLPMMMMNKGLMAPYPEVEVEIEISTVNPQENEENEKRAIEEWNLGPETPSEKPGENVEYWQKMAYTWDIDEAEARRRLCANCEYFDNTPERLEAMESVPFNQFDEGGGGRGYCHKFEFICHNLMVCQAWKRDCR
jgi:hypothetical protein